MGNSSRKSFGSFIVIWIGEWVSGIGSGLTAFALGVYVYQLTQTAASVALLSLCAFLPAILLSPAGGVLADRFDRRLMMLIGDVCSAFGLIFILAIMVLGEPSLWQIYFGITFSSVFASLLEPAYKASISDLLTEDQFAKASGLMQLAASSKYLLSPLIAGFLLRIMDIKAILLIDILTFLTTVLALLAVKKNLQAAPSAPARHSFAEELKTGWQTVGSSKGVMQLTALLSLVTFFIGFLQTLFTPLLLPFTNAQTLGSIESISAVGMLAGSFIISIFRIKGKYFTILTAGLGGAGFFFAMVGVTTNVYWITGAGFLFFAALPFVNTSADVLIRTNIANEAQGRAWGLIGLLSQLGYVAAYVLAGILADDVFNPLLIEGGSLASSVGQVIGTGEGRGTGLLILISGMLLMLTALLIPGLQSIRRLEDHHYRQ